MRRRVIITFVALVLAVYAGVYIGSQSPYVDAQGVTPAPGQHAEIRTPFFFCVWETPSQMGCRAAEFKDEYGKSFYKVDALPGCGEWQVAPGTQPGLLLTPGGTNCPGFMIEFGVLYWFDTPPISVTPSPVLSPPASVTPPLGDGATATPTATGGVATSTPSPPGGTPGHIPTLSPVQERAFSVYCDRTGRGYGMTLWGSRELVYSVPDEWCTGVRDGARGLLRRMAEATPAWVEVRP